MRLVLVLLALSVFQTIASTGYSQNTKITLINEEISLEDVLRRIEDQSEFRFIYDKSQIDLNKKVNVNFNGASVKEVLNEIFVSKGVDYRMIDNQVILKSSGSVLMQQKLSVTGKVSDTSGQPLPGVTVVVKGTTNGTITNFDGVYTLADVSSDAIIQFSFVGMRMQEIAVSGKTSIDIKMEEDAIGIEEVVAVGYGSMKKKDLTGAVGTVQGELISERNSTQLSQAIQGAIPGVMVTRDNGTPGSTANIRIRGITTIGNSNPLVIVDGVPGMDIDEINPNDIESMSVLKDAASASIYGSKAASGVILITTKRAKAGYSSFDYNFEIGLDKPTSLPEYMDSKRYMEVSNELTWNDNGNGSNEYPLFSKDVIDNYDILNADDPNKYPNTDWQNIIFNDFALRSSHNLRFSVGRENLKTTGSFSYDDNDAIYDHGKYRRYTARVNNDLKINDYLNVNLDVNFINVSDEQPSSLVLDDIWKMPSIYPAMWSDGRISGGKGGQNPYDALHYGGVYLKSDNKLSAKLGVDLVPFKGLKLTAILSPTLNYYRAKKHKKQIEYYDSDDPNVFVGYSTNGRTSLSETRNDQFRFTKQFIINYNKELDSHNLGLMSGYEDQYYKAENLGASGSYFELKDYPYLSLGPSDYMSNTGGASEYASRSFFSRVTYSYLNKYLLQANVRFDSSSRFDKNYRWGTFPSLSLGWIVSEESFMPKNSSLSYLKLRGSWGRLGNERIGTYPYQSKISFGSTLLYKGDAVVSATDAAQQTLAIADLSWETTESWNIGFDVNFFDSKLTYSMDVYNKTTKDMLLALEVPDYSGYGDPQQNTGKMKTNGWESVIGWRDNIGGLKYSASINISDFKSVMGDLGGKEFIGSQVKFEGSEYNEWYGFVSDGLFQTQEELENSPTLNSSVTLGDIRFKDISGPEGIPDGKITADYDRVLLGGSLPRYMYGANFRFEYKGIDLSIVLQGVGKQNVILPYDMITPLIGAWSNTPNSFVDNNWSHYKTESENLNAKYPRLSTTSTGNNYTTSDYWMINGAYLRCKNITLGYSVPDSFVKKMRLKKVRIYSSVSDLFVISNSPKGWDPEVGAYSYPITSSFILGCSIKF